MKSKSKISTLKVYYFIVLVFLLISTSMFISIADVAAQEKTESWPTFQYDYQRTGAADNTGPKTNNLVWKWYSGMRTERAYAISLIPAVVDGKVYVGTEENRFVALDEFTGDLIWEFQTVGPVRTIPTVADGKVFFGDCGLPDCYFYALDADSGALVWKYGPVDQEEMSVGIWDLGIVVQDGLVIFGAEDIYALNENTGELVWRHDTGLNDLTLGTSSIDNTLLVSSLDANIYAFNLKTGDQLWSFETGSYIEAVPTVAYGNVYVGSTDNYTYSLDLNTGQLVWQTEHGWSDTQGFGGGGWSHAAVHNNRVLNYGPNGNLVSMDSVNGAISWTFPAGNLTWGGVSIVDGVVYGEMAEESGTNKFYALDETSGVLIWDYEIGGQSFGAPAIVDGMMIWGSHDGYVYAIGEPVLPSEGIPVEYIYAIVAVVAIVLIVVAVVVLRKRS
jgi:outer membrane protein assembly factor BamB